MQDRPSIAPQPNAISGLGKPSDPLYARPLIISIVFLLLCFSVQLYRLIRFAGGSELYSYIILIPFVSAYLVWLQRDQLTIPGLLLPRYWSVIFAVAGGGILVLFFQQSPAPQDSLAFAACALVLMMTGITCWFLNRTALRAIVFPLGFLLFMAPLPVRVEAHLETLLQQGSSVVAQAFFEMIGTPVFRDGTYFHLPNGIDLQVAPECSGIHSTVALFITSLVAGQVLLRSNGNRTILAVVVIPIALLRNGFRVAVIGELCVRIGPEMIHSFIHVHGGPIFFALSLIPFTIVLFFLLRFDRKNEPQIKPTT